MGVAESQLRAMPRRTLRFLCHDCRQLLTKDDRLHYGYQCHLCVATEHDLLHLASRDPDHPDVVRLSASAVELGPDSARRPAGSPKGRSTTG